jgi:hypothetical protein
MSKPRSWFSEWAGKLGIPVWTVWVAVILVGFLVANFFGILPF